MSYASKDIRNIALLGHGGNGKTSLAESILFLTGVTDRLGSTAAGNSVSDYDQEEIRRQISISASTMYTEYQKTKINIIDTPGYFDFAGEVAQALRVADIGIICVSAKDGLNVGAEKAWKALTDAGVPRAIYISKVDEEHADFYKAFEQLREKFGPSLSPMSAPIMDGTKVAGLVDILARKAYKYEGKKRTEIPMPADMSGRVEELYSEIAENAAGTSEELMDKYLETMELSAEEIYGALGTGIAECEITPVFCGSAVTGLGTIVLLDAIKNFFPYPREGGKRVDENAPTKAIVYKTISDQFGKFSLFKVIAGKVTPDMTLVNARSGAQEKLGHIYYMQGKKNIEVQEIGCGDIGAVSKLSDTKTGDTLCDSKAVEAAPGIEYAVPCYSMAIAPKTKGQEDKVAQGLARLGEEDRSFTITNNAETKQMVIAGAGDIHLDVLCSKLKNKFGVEVELSPAKVPYREKIRKPLKAHGRHKKQSGGHGQFGDVWIEFEPQDEQEDMIFAENVFGGSVPKNFFPAVEKGLRECCQKGRPRRLPDGLPQGHPLRRLLPPGRLLRNGLQDRGEPGLQGARQRQPGHPRAHRPAEGHHPRRQHGRHHVRHQLQAARHRHGHERRGRHADRRGRGPHGRDEHLRHRPALHDPGPRLLHAGVLPLQRGSRRRAAEDHRRGQGQRRRVTPHTTTTRAAVSTAALFTGDFYDKENQKCKIPLRAALRRARARPAGRLRLRGRPARDERGRRRRRGRRAHGRL